MYRHVCWFYSYAMIDHCVRLLNPGGGISYIKRKTSFSHQSLPCARGVHRFHTFFYRDYATRSTCLRCAVLSYDRAVSNTGFKHSLSPVSVVEWSKATAFGTEGCCFEFHLSNSFFCMFSLACFPFLTAWRSPYTNEIITQSVASLRTQHLSMIPIWPSPLTCDLQNQ